MPIEDALAALRRKAAASAPKAPDREGSYDPGDHTVDEVKAYVADHPDEVDEIAAAETAGRNRVTLLDWLDTQGQPS